jgi:spore coat polysaccharide biosynthesis protein SpsF (cytidylyltransferase family)
LGSTPEKFIFKEREKMKKIFALSALIASIGFGGLTMPANAAESKSSATIASANANEPQIWRQNRRDRDRNWRNNRSRVRVETRTRIVRVGFRTYRETYQIRYLPNGRTQTRIISRVRIR